MAKRDLTALQKRWVLDRDGHRCQFHTFSGWKLVRCSNNIGLHVHHIKPFRYRVVKGIGIKDGAVLEMPELLVTVCLAHHEMIHPDMKKARYSYHADNKSFSKMAESREELIASGKVYWNNWWDGLLLHIAKEATKAFIEKHPWPIYVPVNGKH